MAAYIRILRWLHVAGLVALLSSCKQPSDADAGARQPAKDSVVAPAQKLTDLFEEY